MKKPLSPEELKKPYAKYYELPVAGPTAEERSWFDQPLKPEEVLPIEQAANFVLGHGRFIGAPNGYYVFPDGTGYTSNEGVVPGVTTELCHWWFRWLNHQPKGIPMEQGNLRYKIWCPPDHWYHGLSNPSDPNSRSLIVESFDLGAGAPPKYMLGGGDCPEALGITQKMLDDALAEGREASAGYGFDIHMNPTGVSVQQFRDVPEGCEWSARSWYGYTVKDGKLVKIEPTRKANIEDMVGERLHNLTEIRHLGVILPLIYKDYKDKPWDED